jgi:hypothetical protein
MILRLLIPAMLLTAATTMGQPAKRQYQTTRCTAPVTIDANPTDSCWQAIEPTNQFIQYEPYAGAPSKFNSEVKIIYSDYAIYVLAQMYDPNPDSIMQQLSTRDNIGQSDFFGLSIDGFNDAQTGYTFIVTPRNVQFDARESDWEDTSWDAVWRSATAITSYGWVAEMEIPYSALRFPKLAEQIWQINMVRNVQRFREKSFWNFVDPKVQGYLRQSGLLTGITNIQPPLRLSFTPYVSGYMIKNSQSDGLSYSYKGGLDVKYGLTESHTLDMMLIPDFGQVESDDKVLNISPFEVYYEEKRPFFTEGTELFDKGEIFYSRRIGGVPQGFYDVETDSSEKITENPQEVPLINVTKLSGKGRNGLGIGLLNGLGKNTYATITDTVTNTKRKVLTQPFTNYNVMVFDQRLKNNSSAAITNTNYYQPDVKYIANVTATDVHLENKKNTYAFDAILGASYIDDRGLTDSAGYKYNVGISKIKGNFLFTIDQRVANKTYNPNDLGYQDKTNEMQNRAQLRYNIYEPFGRFMSWYNSATYKHFTYYDGFKDIGNQLFLNSFATFRNYLSLGLYSEFTTTDYHDYYEAHTPGRVLEREGYAALGGTISPDYRKKFVFETEGGYWKGYDDFRHGFWLSLRPMLRVNDHLNLNVNINANQDLNDIGFMDKLNDTDSIIMSMRDVKTLTNYLNVNYIFNAKSAVSMRLRHYWRTIEHEKFYLLNLDGTLAQTDNLHYDNVSKNYFNIDGIYTWRFAPGSEMSLVYKLAINHDDEVIESRYFRNVSNMFDVANDNSLSVRFLYYIDYLQLKRQLKG